MKLTLLTDNHTYIDQYYLGEPAFSCWIEAEGQTFLFDTGYSDVFARNAEKMGLSVSALSAVVLSHGHNDHTGGLTALGEALGERRLKLIAHPAVFARKFSDGLEIGCPVPEETLRRHFTPRLTAQPLWLTEHLAFLGEIPEGPERRRVSGTLADGSPDLCLDDSALAYAGREGLYLVTGCSHSGICNIAEYAKQVTGKQKILGIIGGFHLFENNPRSRETAAYLEKENIPELWPCHCTAFCVRAELSRRMNVREAGVGLTLDWE